MSNYNTTSGIYKITNVTDSKTYIGQSQEVERRIRNHRSSLRGNRHTNELLQRAFDKHKKFSFEVIEMCDYKDLDEKETFWISFFDSTNRNYGYNFEDGGNLLKKHHIETIEKMRLSARGHNNKLQVKEVETIKKRLCEGIDQQTLSKDFNVCWTTISKIKTCNNWEWVLPELNDDLVNPKKSEVKEEILFHYKVGMGSKELSDLSGYPTQLIQKNLSYLSEKIMNERHEDIRIDYNKGMLRKEMMEKYDVTYTVINNAMPNQHEKERQERNDKVMALYEQGVMIKDIAKEVGIHRTTVTDITYGRTNVKIKANNKDWLLDCNLVTSVN